LYVFLGCIRSADQEDTMDKKEKRFTGIRI
jgi:hypothetical protein